MHARLFLFAATAAISSAQTTTTTSPGDPHVSAAPGSLPLGAKCSNSEQCANGAECYGVTSFTITTCGSFQSSCTDDSQCATNTCNQGLCNGYLDPSSSPAASSSATATISLPARTPTADAAPTATGTLLPLGAECNTTDQCAGGAQCWASNSMLIKACGKFNAACESDAQCATNTCNNGLCNGFLASQSDLVNSAAPTGGVRVRAFSSAANANMTPTATVPAPSHNGTAPTQSPSMSPIATAGAGRMMMGQCGLGLAAAVVLACWL